MFICFHLYVLTPIIVLVTSFKITLTGVIDPDEEKVNSFQPFDMSAKDLPLLLLYEQFFEAIPQIILSIVFLSNNYSFLLAFDTILGIPLSLISCVFSGGSLMMGIYSSYKACLGCCGLCLFILSGGHELD